MFHDIGFLKLEWIELLKLWGGYLLKYVRNQAARDATNKHVIMINNAVLGLPDIK